MCSIFKQKAIISRSFGNCFVVVQRRKKMFFFLLCTARNRWSSVERKSHGCKKLFFLCFMSIRQIKVHYHENKCLFFAVGFKLGFWALACRERSSVRSCDEKDFRYIMAKWSLSIEINNFNLFLPKLKWRHIHDSTPVLRIRLNFNENVSFPRTLLGGKKRDGKFSSRR